METSFDQKYMQILLDRLEVCRQYKPRFGQGGEGLSLEQFQSLYGTDPFYAWFGLDNPLMYTAHRAAGGITSVYRQIGIGGEVLFRQLLQDHLGLTYEQSIWSYEITVGAGRTRILKLDGRIELEDVADHVRQENITTWMSNATRQLDLDARVANAMRGIVMEVRQGYKSKDSKRQNADMSNATAAYTKGYLPVLILLSTQIDSDVVERYERGKWLVLQGFTTGSNVFSTYTFTREIIGYDLAAFFQRNSVRLKNYLEDLLESLLRASDNG